MQRLGQHFLQSSAAIKKIISALNPAPGETIVEIGPGHGELTLPLAEICGSIGCNLVAIEKDPALASALREKFSEERRPVQIVLGDVRKILAAHVPEAGPWKLVGNIPYYLTGYLFRVVGNLGKKPLASVFTVQKEVGERLMAEPPHMNRLAAAVQFWGVPEKILTLPRGYFSPSPKVDSMAIKISTRAIPQTAAESARYDAAIKNIFAQPRKTILNNLAERRNGGAISKEKIATKLRGLGIEEGRRPQNLAIEDVRNIADAFFAQ